MTLCGFAGGLDGAPGFASAGFAGVCGQFAVQGAEEALLCGDEAGGSGDCAKAARPEIEKMNTRAKIWGRTEKFSLLTRTLILSRASGRAALESLAVSLSDISSAGETELMPSSDEPQARYWTTRVSVVVCVSVPEVAVMVTM